MNLDNVKRAAQPPFLFALSFTNNVNSDRMYKKIERLKDMKNKIQTMLAAIFGKSKSKPEEPQATQPQPPTISPIAKAASNEENPKTKNHKVTGTAHYEKDIMKLASENEDYLLSKKGLIEAGLIEESVYQYSFWINKTELIPEPTNEYDPNAIKVVIDGVHVGYIKAGSCKHVLKLINEDRIAKIEGKIGGGAYKCLIAHDDSGTDFELIKDKKNISIIVSITEK